MNPSPERPGHKCKVFKYDGLWFWRCAACDLGGWRFNWANAVWRAISHFDSNSHD